jgi:hypothetical protein
MFSSIFQVGTESDKCLARKNPVIDSLLLANQILPKLECKLPKLNIKLPQHIRVWL